MLVIISLAHPDVATKNIVIIKCVYDGNNPIQTYHNQIWWIQ